MAESIYVKKVLRLMKDLDAATVRRDEAQAEVDEIRTELSTLTIKFGIGVKPEFPEDKFIVLTDQKVKLHHINMGRRDYDTDSIARWAKRNDVYSMLFPRTFKSGEFLAMVKDGEIPKKEEQALAPNAGVYSFRITKINKNSCPKCAEPTKANQKFCHECGTALKANASTPEKKVVK
jgi:hypothetical protein